MGASALVSGMMNAQMQLQQAQESQLLQQANSSTGPGQTAKIKKAAREFEALLLQGWLQQAESSLATVPGAEDDDSSSGGQGTMSSLGMQALSGAMAASGGIGLGAMIEKALLAVAEKSGPAAQIDTKNSTPR